MIMQAKEEFVKDRIAQKKKELENLAKDDDTISGKLLSRKYNLKAFFVNSGQ